MRLEPEKTRKKSIFRDFWVIFVYFRVFSCISGFPGPKIAKSTRQTAVRALKGLGRPKFFFHRLSPPAGLAYAAGFDIALQQLPSSAGDGMWIQAKEASELAIAAVSQLEGFDGGIEATLFFIQRAVEQQDSRFQFVGGNLQATGIGDGGNGLEAASGEHLPPPGG